MPRYAILTPVAICLAMLAAPPANAQQFISSAVVVDAGPGGPGMGGAMGLGKRRFKNYLNMLQASDVQREAADGIYEAFAAERQDMQMQMMAKMSEMRADAEDFGGSMESIEDLLKITRDHQEAMEKLEASLFDDLQLLLDEEQTAHWPRVERARLRDELLPEIGVSGGSVDLVDIVGELDAMNQVEEALLAYETDVDRVLKDRSRLMEDAAASRGNGISFDPDTIMQMQESMNKLRENGLRVRDTNERHARAVEAAIGEELRPQLAELIRNASFPRIYKKSHVDRIVDAGAAFEDLTPDQRAQLDQIAATYGERRSNLDATWAGALREAEESGDSEVGWGGMSMRISFDADEDESPVETARKARRDLDRETTEQLTGLFTEEQRSRLPKRESEFEFGDGAVRMIRAR